MDPRIAWAVDYMRTHLAAPVAVADLAARVNLSPSRFAHLFRREVGTAPGTFLRAVRMARARLLLERTFLSVKEVMTLVGCNDPSHFSRDFRRVHGQAPRAWRHAYGEPRGAATDTTVKPIGVSTAADAAGSAHIRQKTPTIHKRPREPGHLSWGRRRSGPPPDSRKRGR
jgi:AraC-like DNA-binding protein